MPETPEAGGDAELHAIARAVEAGEDAIAVPAELLHEAERAARPKTPALYAQILTMTIGEKIKLALRGNKDARMILVRDANKLIRRFVLQNPRITDGEVIGVCRNRSADEEALRTIADKREWIRNYQVKLALVQNPKTPIAIALRQIPSLDERDVRQLAKSKNVPGAVATHCRRIMFAKQQKET